MGATEILVLGGGAAAIAATLWYFLLGSRRQVPVVAVSASMVERLTLPVAGMNCTACAARVENALRETAGVSAANVNFATREATIEYDLAQVDRAGLARRIVDSGYTVPEP